MAPRARARLLAWFLAEGLSGQLWALRACLTSPFTPFRHSHTKYTHPNTKYMSLNSKHTIPYTKYTHRTCSQMIVCVRRGKKSVPPRIPLSVRSSVQGYSRSRKWKCKNTLTDHQLDLQPKRAWGDAAAQNMKQFKSAQLYWDSFKNGWCLTRSDKENSFYSPEIWIYRPPSDETNLQKN